MNRKSQFALDFLFALLVLCATVILLRVGQPYFWLSIFPDDAYYYLRIAQNIVAGLGSSFDGINQTNGYHPLWMMILTALAAVFRSPEGLVRATLVFQVLATSAGFAFLGLSFSETGKSRKALWIAGALVFLNPISASIFINGLESAIYFLALSFGFRLWMNLQKKTPGSSFSWLGAGLFFGMVFLSRLDGGILAVWLLIAILISEGGFSARLKKALAFGIGFVLLAAPYLIYNFLEYGHPLPISGRVKAYYMSHNIYYLLGLTLLFAFAIGAVLLFHFLARKRLSGFSKTLLSYLEFSLSTVFYYLLTPVYAFGVWYYLPMVLVLILISGWIFSALLGTRHFLAKALAGALVMLGALGIFGGFFYYLNPSMNSTFQAQAEVTDWIKKNTPEDALLSAWSSGGVAYFSGRQTVNLDGLVNSADYFFNYRVKGRREEFMKKVGADYVVVYYEYDSPTPNDKFGFKIKNVFESKINHRSLATHFKPSTVTYFVLQTEFCKHFPVGADTSPPK